MQVASIGSKRSRRKQSPQPDLHLLPDREYHDQERGAGELHLRLRRPRPPLSALNPTLPNEAFTYDALGNRLTSAATTGQWSHNANNQLKGYDTTTFDYDPNGNLTRKATSTQTRDFIYSIDDRLLREKEAT